MSSNNIADASVTLARMAAMAGITIASPLLPILLAPDRRPVGQHGPVSIESNLGITKISGMEKTSVCAVPVPGLSVARDPVK